MKKTMKKILCSLLVVVMCLTAAPLQGFVGLDWSWLDFSVKASVAEEGYYTYSVSDGKATITDIDTSISGDVTIPSALGGYGVTSIGIYAFEECKKLTSVTIPNSVTSIEAYAFSDCTNLTSIVIPNSVTYIGSDAFRGCTGLASITIPNSVTSIGSDALYNTAYYNNESNWTNKVLYVDNHLIKAIDSITSHDIRRGTRTISDEAFMNCTSFTSITVPNSVTYIGSDAFRGCTGLTSITIPDSVTYIGFGAFSNCTGLKSIIIPNSVESISSGTFSNCTSLTSVTISNSVTSIGDGAFYGCTGLKSITIPNGVKFIDDSAFYDCTGLESIIIPNGVKSISLCAFRNCTSLTSVTIPNSVTFIDAYAFSGCTSLTSIMIPDSVISIDEATFSDCTNLKNITIPDSVTYIGFGAFSNCTELKSIIIPNSVESISSGTFSNCTSLTSITIPNSVTYIHADAFSDCTSLTSITIPDSVTYIDADAFYNTAYYNNESNWTNKVLYIGNHLIKALDSITSHDIRQGTKTIAMKSFMYCTSLTEITIPNGVTHIGFFAFNDCINLKSITIPDSVTSIDVGAFMDCYNITDVYFGGTEEKWKSITIESNNYELLNATIHYLGNIDPSDYGYKLRLRSDGAYSDSIAVGETIGFWTTLYNNGNRLDCDRAYAISFDNPGIFKVEKTEIRDYSFDIDLKAVKAGTTNMTVSDSKTGAYVTIKLKANNPVEVLTLDEVKSMAKDYEGIRTNFYDYNGLYVNNFSYREKSDYYNVSMDVYNEKAHYGAAVSYDKNGNIHQFQIIDQQDKIPTHLWDALFDVYDWVNYELEVFHDKAYTNTVRTKPTPIDIDVPVGGHLVVTNNINNEIAFMSTITDLSLDFLFALGDIAFDDIPIDITYKVPEKVIRQIIAIAGSKALSSICTSIFKKYTKGVTAATAVSIISELSDKLEDVGVDYFALLKDAVKDTFDTETALNIGEDIGLKLVGLGGVKELLDGCDYINTFIKMYDMSASLLASEIAIYTPPEAPYVRKSNGVTVTSETELSSDCVLHTYVINENDNVMAEAESTIAKLNSNYEMHDITLYKSSQAVQPDAKIKVMIPIPNGYDKEKISVYWYKDDGTLELMNATVEGDYAVFETDHLSYYILTDHSHSDSDNDGVCEVCECTFCFCMCHKDGLIGFVWKVFVAIFKIFKTNPTCFCGVAHY